MTDEPQQAATVKIVTCSCPSLHILLLDDNGEVFATASMPLETGMAVAENITDAIREAIGADGIGECRGHA